MFTIHQELARNRKALRSALLLGAILAVSVSLNAFVILEGPSQHAQAAQSGSVSADRTSPRELKN
jgi:hypothetical protein